MFPLAVIFVNTKLPSKIALLDASDNVTLSEKLPLSVFKFVTLVEKLPLSVFKFVTLVEKLPEFVFKADILDVIAVNLVEKLPLGLSYCTATVRSALIAARLTPATVQ